MKQMIGISVGSQNTVVGVLKHANVDIILSETSSRCVPTISAFGDRERAFGDSAFSTIKSNFNRSVMYPNRWLGIQPDWPQFQEEGLYSTFQPQVDKHNRVGFEINYKNEQEIYYPEQLMGLFFNKLKQNWFKAGYETKEVVVTVPDYYTAQERKAMLDSLVIADLNCTSLVNESSAIAIEYGLKRRAQFDEKVQKIVAFVDMGQSKTTISFAAFTKNSQKVISVTSERFCGAREFDYLLMQHFANIFNTKYGCNPITSAKLRLRMMDAICKTRKTLTVNQEAGVSIESLMDDYDLFHNLTRDEFEKIISPVLQKFRDLLQKAILTATAEGKFQLADLSSVEMAGDAVRTPIIQQIIKEVTGLQVSKTLLPDECLARGATFYAAMNSPFFSLKDFTFEHYNPYSVVLEYPFMSNLIFNCLEDGQVQLRTHTIIKKGENLPNKKSIKFTEKQMPKQDVVQLRLFYNNEEVGFLNNTLLSTYMVSIPHVKEEQWTFLLIFYIDQHGLPSLDKASVNEIYYEDAPVPTTKTTQPAQPTPQTDETKQAEPKPEEKKAEKVKKERQTVSIIKLVESFFGMPQNMLDSVTQKEASCENDDRLLDYAINKRNEIENFIYSTRSKLDGDLAAFITPEEKDLLMSLMQKMEDWFYSGDEEVYVKTTLEEKGKDLNELGTKLYKRYHDWTRLGESFEKLESVINLNIRKTSETTPQTALLNLSDRDELTKLINQYQQILSQSRVDANQVSKLLAPPVKHEDIDKFSEELVRKCSTVLQNAEKRVKDEQKKKEEEEKKKREEQKADVTMTEGQTTPPKTETTPTDTKKEFNTNMDVD